MLFLTFARQQQTSVFTPAMSNPRPSSGFRCSISPHFDNLKFDTSDAPVHSTTLSRLHCVLGYFHVSTDTLVQNVYLVF